MDQGDIAGAAAEVAGVAGVAAADVDDAAPTLFFEQGDGGPGAAEGADVLDIEVAEQGVLVDGFNVAYGVGGAAGEGCAVDHNVEAAELGCGVGYYLVHLVGLGNIQRHRGNGAAGGVGDFPGRGFQLFH